MPRYAHLNTKHSTDAGPVRHVAKRWWATFPLSIIVLACATISVAVSLYVDHNEMEGNDTPSRSSLPYISWAGRTGPERIVFSVGMTLAGVLYAVLAGVGYVLFERIARLFAVRDPDPAGPYRWKAWAAFHGVNVVCVAFGVLAALFMVLLSQVYDSATNANLSTPHVVFAILFFVCVFMHVLAQAVFVLNVADSDAFPETGVPTEVLKDHVQHLLHVTLWWRIYVLAAALVVLVACGVVWAATTVPILGPIAEYLFSFLVLAAVGVWVFEFLLL